MLQTLPMGRSAKALNICNIIVFYQGSSKTLSFVPCKPPTDSFHIQHICLSVITTLPHCAPYLPSPKADLLQLLLGGLCC
jgi:hypothetical protein